MIRNIFLAIAVLAVASCVTTTEDSIALSCKTYASTLATLATANVQGKLSDSQVEKVDGLVAVAAPICEEGKWDDPVTALNDLDRAIFELARIQGEN
jgi:hypothetical protein